jgi:PAS domain S-box-containing protein
MTENGPALNSSYNPWLVGLSVIIAICASYTALGLGSRTTLARGSRRAVWLGGGAVAMGFGIWSMHYVGMLAFSLPLPVRYDVPTVVVSLAAAVFASGVALFVVSRAAVTVIQAGAGGLLMGTGIVAMHYTGMEAMRLPAMCRYDGRLLALSCVIAVIGSLAALWFTFHLRIPGERATALKALSAVAMGAAIAAMHYTGMAAASFQASRQQVDYSHAVSVSDLGITAIVIVTFLVLAFAFFTSLLDQQLSAQQVLSEELYQSRQMLRSVLDNIPQRVFWKDFDGHYLGCNLAFAAYTGLNGPNEIIGKTDEDLPRLKELSACADKLRETLETGEAVMNQECEIATEDGQSQWLRSNSVALRDFNGRIYGFLGTYEETTKQKQAQEAIERSNAALSDFAEIVSHDLQSPLRIANNYVQLLAMRYRDRLDQEGKGLLESIESSLHSMAELIQSLLRYATATGPEPEGRGTVALASVVDRAIANLALPIAETGMQINSDTLPEVIGYRMQLTQVFQNLISNAIKYRKAGIRPRIHISASEGTDAWVISVRDNGIGIAEKYYDRIFSPLKRLHGAEIPGFGIGLATCQKLVEHHGGNIWVDSKPDVGSTFYFRLPKGSESAAKGRHAAGSA